MEMYEPGRENRRHYRLTLLQFLPFGIVLLPQRTSVHLAVEDVDVI